MNKWIFKEFDINDAPALIPYFRLRPTKVCDATIFDSYLWRRFYHAHFCVLDGRALIWRWGEEEDAFMSLPQCTAADLPHYFDEMILHYHEISDKKAIVFGFDDEALDILKLDPDRFDILSNEAHFDYMYRASDLMTLPGKRYHKKKNHINAFLKEYEGRWEYRTLSTGDIDEVLAFLKYWEGQKSDTSDAEHLEAEYAGMQDILTDDRIHRVEGRIGGIFIDGRLEAFSVGTLQPDIKMAIIHIEKANPLIRGLYALINREFLLHELPDAELVNREDDLGLPGLRKAKESYHPCEMVRKYTAVEK